MSEPTAMSSTGMPRGVAEAVARQIERDHLNELITAAEAEHGPITEAEIQARREEVHRLRQSLRHAG
ncbi:CopG family transcriptional regulator [Streptomyces sp. 4N509B]|uniref:CopG family transcriptional regulator n=1 Tax=Streptomyces sp. 4N509B TaxID=3457413 RepID=UPI003FD27C60